MDLAKAYPATCCQIFGECAETRADLIRWVVAVGLLQTSIIVGVLLIIAHFIYNYLISHTPLGNSPNISGA